MPKNQESFTELLRAYRAGNSAVFGELFLLVYDEVKRIARRQLNGERRNHTLDSVALANEAYLRLGGQKGGVSAENRVHFYAICAQVMRTLLMDYAEYKKAQKRGGGDAIHVRLSQVQGLPHEAGIEHALALNLALEKLGAIDAETERIAEMRCLMEMTLKETAAALGLPYIRTRRKWKFARGWLERELT